MSKTHAETDWYSSILLVAFMYAVNITYIPGYDIFWRSWIRMKSRRKISSRTWSTLPLSWKLCTLMKPSKFFISIVIKFWLIIKDFCTIYFYPVWCLNYGTVLSWTLLFSIHVGHVSLLVKMYVLIRITVYLFVQYSFTHW